jgi:rhamnosyltransferase
MKSLPRVTVLMRCKNSDWVIAQALAGLFAQTYTDFELLVVDSGSTDKTLDIVSSYPCRLEKIPPQNYYPGAVLNQAIEGISTELVVFLNSDCVPLAPETLGRLVAAFDDPTVMAAFGRQLPRPEADAWVRRDYAEAFPASGDAPPWITFSLPIAGFRHAAWEQRKFYTDAWGSEDTDWGRWARQQPGWKVVYVPDAITMHSHNYTLRQLYGRRFIEGEADAFIYRDQDSLSKMLKRAVVSTARDIFYHLRHQDGLNAMVTAPARRAVYQWAYYKGHQHGEKRIAEQDTDVSFGQKVVLARHESNRESMRSL